MERPGNSGDRQTRLQLILNVFNGEHQFLLGESAAKALWTRRNCCVPAQEVNGQGERDSRRTPRRPRVKLVGRHAMSWQCAIGPDR